MVPRLHLFILCLIPITSARNSCGSVHLTTMLSTDCLPGTVCPRQCKREWEGHACCPWSVYHLGEGRLEAYFIQFTFVNYERHRTTVGLCIGCYTHTVEVLEGLF